MSSYNHRTWKGKTVLLLGSGALKIGEAGEFDYSGTQAIKALKEEEKRVILVNPNVATIQTSDNLADEVYFLPVSPAFVERVINKEKPDGILLSFGGQTALNCGIELDKSGVLGRHKVDILGTPVESLVTTEDRKFFSDRFSRMGFPTAKGRMVTSMVQGLAFAKTLGYPVMVRSGFALGGTGSGIARIPEHLNNLLTKAFAFADRVMIEESLYGWKEVEYEVVRDVKDNCIAVCNMENMDPVGIHTGESIVVAPSQTLCNREYFMLRQIAIDVIRELKIVGECNIQFAIHPKRSEFRIIEVNARLSRSSALASKATGYPLAYVAAKLALGITLPELPNAITRVTSAFFEPALDYVVVKLPRWDLDKFVHVDDGIGTEMKSVGEVMSIARTFEEAIQKGTRMLNDGYEGVIDKRFGHESPKRLFTRLKKPDSMRLFTVCSALRAGISVDAICALTRIDPWFLHRLKNIVDLYQRLDRTKKLTKHLLREAKYYGFSDKQIADITGKDQLAIRALRKKYTIAPMVKRIDTMAGEYPARTNYFYLTYAGTTHDYFPKKDEQRIIIIGCGPYAIGTSVEFDWCAVATADALRKRRIKSVMINCNPETVSTDFDTADYLYFEELTLERVLDIYEVEASPCILSVGGQIPNTLAAKLADLNIPIVGTQASAIYQAEHRKSFAKLLDELDIRQPPWQEAYSLKQSLNAVSSLGYPVIVRPSFVLSGKSMAVIDCEEALKTYMKTYDLDLKEHPLVITKFLDSVTECDFDAVAQKGNIILWAISEHVESGGVHSGDSTLMLPTVTLSTLAKNEIQRISQKISAALAIHGPFNIQFLIQEDVAYVIECNLRASRSFPFVSKALHQNFVSVATRVVLGERLSPIAVTKPAYQVVKVPQFSFHKLRGADPVVKVEMSSTGEVSAFGRDVFEAYVTAIMATGAGYQKKKAVFLSLGGMMGKLQFLKGAHLLSRLGYTFYATSGTHLFLKENAIESVRVSKIYEGGPLQASRLFHEKHIDFAVVIPEHYADRGVKTFQKTMTDGYRMRRLAADMGIPIFSDALTAKYFAEALYRYPLDTLSIYSWREYIQGIFKS